MSHVSERRQFLRGRFRGESVGLLPPWSGPRAAFLETCTRCDECATACAAGILVRGDGGYPEVDFQKGECLFCGDCVVACVPHALQRRNAAPWHLMPYVHESCLAWQGIDCRRCSEVCDRGALRMSMNAAGNALPVIDSAACNGCGACIAPCPVAAMRLQEVA